MRRRPAAAVDEEAELRALSERAEQSRRAVAETAGALSQAIAANAGLRPLMRRGLSHLTARVSRPWLVVPVPTVLATTVVAVYLLRRRNGRSPARGGRTHDRAGRPHRALPLIGRPA